jgi:hypothetical protein
MTSGISCSARKHIRSLHSIYFTLPRSAGFQHTSRPVSRAEFSDIHEDCRATALQALLALCRALEMDDSVRLRCLSLFADQLLPTLARLQNNNSRPLILLAVASVGITGSHRQRYLLCSDRQSSSPTPHQRFVAAQMAQTNIASSACNQVGTRKDGRIHSSLCAACREAGEQSPNQHIIKMVYEAAGRILGEGFSMCYTSQVDVARAFLCLSLCLPACLHMRLQSMFGRAPVFELPRAAAW